MRGQGPGGLAGAAAGEPPPGQAAPGLAPLLAAIGAGVPLLVLSAHLDDAVLSCGALMLHATAHTEVSVLTLFTEGRPPPYTLSARRYLHQVGAQDAETLYVQRRAEDRAVLARLGAVCVHAGLTEALFRLRPRAGRRSAAARLLPELAHLYPVYRVHITSGRLAPADAGTVAAARAIVQRLAGPAVVLAPLAVGGHVDHVLARTAAEQSGAPLAYYSDFPHNQHHPADAGFLARRGLTEASWPRLLEAKAGLVRGYRTQVRALFPDGRIPLAPEVFYLSPGLAAGAGGPGSRTAPGGTR